MDDPASLSFILLAETAADPASISLYSVLLNILLVLALVLGNGFFVASEFALVAVRKSRIESLAAEGSRAAQRLLECLNNLNAYISATQLGVTMFSLGLGWVGEPAVAMFLEPLIISIGNLTGASFLVSGAVLQTISFVVAFSIITFVLIVLGELAPKTIALEVTEKVALAIALPIQIFYKTFYYPIRLLYWTGAKTVRLFGLHPSGEEGSVYSEEEIRHLIDISKKSGHLNEEEQKLIHQVFEFSETTVREAMVPRPEIFAIPVTYDLNEIAEAFRESGFSRFPVYRESLDDIAGVIHSKDVMSYLLNPEAFRIEKILRRPVYVVDTARLEDVLRKMQTEKFHFGFVVDEHGGVEGIITLEDLLEEIVGEIADEYDEEVAEQIYEQKDGSYILDGGLAVRDLNKKLGLNVPVSEGYTTIAGFLMAEAGQVLTEGERVKFNGHEFVVQEVDRRRITRVKMEKVEAV
ncbi:MAG: HlyC/CorC family transporter [Acidobacteriota bacterium]|nr:MAG: HlyC/CorC family transporter [Acidobacteriota bacterium]